MSNQFIVVARASNLDTVVVNVSHISHIYELDDNCSFIVFYVDSKEERGLKVTDSVDELLNQFDGAFPFVELETILKERVFVNVSKIITITEDSKNVTFIELFIKRKKSRGLKIAMSIREVFIRVDNLLDSFN
ncbi:MAG: hypothetical protein K2L70_04510 [Clostridia bacterium]|nr:hypothetical protein [Clostridia bacterium]